MPRQDSATYGRSRAHISSTYKQEKGVRREETRVPGCAQGEFLRRAHKGAIPAALRRQREGLAARGSPGKLKVLPLAVFPLGGGLRADQSGSGGAQRAWLRGPPLPLRDE